MKPLDLFWSFRSPYSYLAVPGAIRLERDFAVKIRFRPVLPLAVRDPSFFSADNLKRAKYIRLDAPRRAQMLGIPFAWPKPDPIVQDMQTYKIAGEQPFIFRLTYLGAEAERLGRGLASKRWMRLSPPATALIQRLWKTIKRPLPRQATGAYRPSLLKTNRSLGKIGSRPCVGAWNSVGCRYEGNKNVAVIAIA
jgi:hypothetical protein